MYNVLVAVDRNEEYAENQADYVVNLPEAPETVRARVLYVYPQRDYSGAPPQDFEEIDAAVAAADRIEAAGVEVERRTDGGNVTKRITRHAEEIDADDIVMGGRKRSGVSRVVLGSVTQDVIFAVDRPVTIAL
ncbi:MAG: universal stress protein [Halobacteriales archaeon]